MPDKKQSILIGAIVSLVLALPYLSLINCLCCAGAIIGGLVAVWHYTDTHKVTIETGQGALMGCIAAATGFFASIFVNYFLLAIGFGAGQEIMMDFMMENFGASMSPEQLEQFEAAAEQEPSFVGQFFTGLIFTVLGSIFGAVGGAIGAAVFKKGGSASTGTVETTTPVEGI